MDRRNFIKAVSASSIFGISGCLGDSEGSTENDINSGELPMGDKKNVEYKISFLERNLVSGNAGGEDAIPSIDSPNFISSDEHNPDNFDDNIVFGIKINGEAKAYPRLILANHEIVNDSIGGTDVSITYCPLTGTVLAYERGGVEFGVSGRLLNNNLVMFDRDTGSYWPQMIGMAISGERKGDFLKEREVVWTTWDRWVKENPDTKVLSTETGFLRNYSRGVYGSYNDRSGYYSLNQGPLFSPLEEDDRLPPKKEVLGGRTEDKSYMVTKEKLRSEEIVNFKNKIVAVYDNNLDTGYMYLKDEESTISTTDSNMYKVEGREYEADSLPFERVVSDYEAMWFAWYGLFPNTEVIL